VSAALSVDAVQTSPPAMQRDLLQPMDNSGFPAQASDFVSLVLDAYDVQVCLLGDCLHSETPLLDLVVVP
jgi:hypothetical protein